MLRIRISGIRIRSQHDRSNCSSKSSIGLARIAMLMQLAHWKHTSSWIHVQQEECSQAMQVRRLNRRHLLSTTTLTTENIIWWHYWRAYLSSDSPPCTSVSAQKATIAATRIHCNHVVQRTSIAQLVASSQNRLPSDSTQKVRTKPHGIQNDGARRASFALEE